MDRVDARWAAGFSSTTALVPPPSLFLKKVHDMSGWYNVFMTLLDGCYDGDCGHKGMRLGVGTNSLSVFSSGRFLLRDLNVRLNEAVMNSDDFPEVWRKPQTTC